MFTVVTSLLVLLAFGQRFDKKFIVYAVIVFIGVALVNISEGLRAASITDAVPLSDMLLYGALPALIAAFSYPIGNQLVWQASHNARQRNTELQKAADLNVQRASISVGIDISEQSEPLISEAYDLPATTYDATDIDSVLQSDNIAATSSLQNLIARIPSIETTLLQNAFNKVWLMTLGCLPFWLFLGIIVRPDQPHPSQIINTLLVALLAGVAATTIFLYAREQAVTSSEVAGVDSTQASEVIFALIGGILLLDNAIPSAMGLVGIGLIIVGLIFFAKDG